MLHQQPRDAAAQFLHHIGQMSTDLAAAAGSRSAETFDISFGASGSPPWLQFPTRTRWKLIGNGQLCFDGSDVVILSRRHRILRAARPEEVRFARLSVINVARDGTNLRFEVSTPDGNEPVSFHTADAATAEEIERLLPATRTEEFTKRRAEQSQVEASLQSIGARTLVVPVLVAINVIVFIIAGLMGAGWITADGEAMVRLGSNYSVLTLGGQWWRLFTSMFLHFGAIHLLLNMWVLWSVGPTVERLFGSLYFALLYTFAGLCGSIASLLWHPLINSAGASGAIFGLFGGLLAFVINPRTHIPASIMSAQRNSALAFIAYNLIYGVSRTGIDNAAHVGGLIGGLLIGFVLARPLNVEARADELPRFGLTAAAALAFLMVVSSPLWHPDTLRAAERGFLRNYYELRDLDRKADAAHSSLANQLNAKRITQAQWVEQMNKQVFPLWDAMHSLAHSSSLPSQSRYAAVQAKLVEAIDEQKSGQELYVRAVANQDGDARARALQLIGQSAASAEQAGRLLRALP
jgi:rhomboid protease GluP